VPIFRTEVYVSMKPNGDSNGAASSEDGHDGTLDSDVVNEALRELVEPASGSTT
jgi:hypothetical protein